MAVLAELPVMVETIEQQDNEQRGMGRDILNTADNGYFSAFSISFSLSQGPWGQFASRLGALLPDI